MRPSIHQTILLVNGEALQPNELSSISHKFCAILARLALIIVNRGQGLEGRQTSKAFELINFRCWKGTSRDISGASNSEINTIA
jgi:hypothetical protein